MSQRKLLQQLQLIVSVASVHSMLQDGPDRLLGGSCCSNRGHWHLLTTAS